VISFYTFYVDAISSQTPCGAQMDGGESKHQSLSLPHLAGLCNNQGRVKQKASEPLATLKDLREHMATCGKGQAIVCSCNGSGGLNPACRPGRLSDFPNHRQQNWKLIRFPVHFR